MYSSIVVSALVPVKVTVLRFPQPSNACLPMVSTEAGMTMFERLEQPSNADTPMDVSPLPSAKVTVARFVQS